MGQVSSASASEFITPEMGRFFMRWKIEATCSLLMLIAGAVVETGVW
jgi:hypothetical protein